MKHLLTMMLLFVWLTLAAQNQCPTTLNISQLQLQDPTRYQRFTDLEAFTANYIANQANTGQAH